MKLADKLRKLRKRRNQREIETLVVKYEIDHLETAQQYSAIQERVCHEDVSFNELKYIAEHYEKQLANVSDEIRGIVEQRSNSKIALVADFVLVLQNADRILEYPAIEKLVTEAAQNLKNR